MTIEAQLFFSSDHQKRLSYPILGDKPVKNVKIDQQTKDKAIRYVFRE